MQHILRNRKFQAVVSLLLALCLGFSLLPTRPAQAATTAAVAAMKQLEAWDILKGYPGGDLAPDRPITRAEFVAMVNRAYGYVYDDDPRAFTDVPEGAWYEDDLAIASTAGYFKGRSPTIAAPNESLTREEAMVLLAKCMRLDKVSGEVTEFTDGRNFGKWSSGYVKAAVKNRLIKGYKDGTFRPKNPITRGEMAQLLVRSLGTLVPEGGVQTLGDVYGNVTVSTPNTTLRNTTIAGNLYISGGLGLGAVTLDNVTVTGRIVVAGGGVSETGEDSVILQNVQAGELLVDNLAERYLSVRADGDTTIDNVNVRSSAYLQDRTGEEAGLRNIKLDSKGSAFTVSGNLKNVTNLSPDSSLLVSRGTVQNLTVDEAATGSALNIDPSTTVKVLNLDAGVPVTGTGDIEQFNVNASGATAAILPDKIEIRPGLQATIDGTNMDTKLGQESSEAPRLLAGYPLARDVAPTTATAVFSCNKSGTVYWAVSSVTDGSVSEADLIAPPAYGAKIIKSGNVRAAASSTEYSANVTGLTTGGSYYLSAVLVDARGDRSPVKVYSFETPDDTVPNFATGSPYMSKISNTYAQVSVTPTKSCNLYYALYDKGASAPTAKDFRSGSLTGSLGNGVLPVTKNFAEYVNLGDRNFETDQGTLQELAEYDLYLFLSDPDGTKSSAVQKLTFRTADKTPPVFVTEPGRPNPVQATSVGLQCSINEQGTVYWVAVKEGADYPKPQLTDGKIPSLDSLDAKIQVASGTGGVKSGKAAARPNTEVRLTISGLEAESAYDVYYVAQDAAGNYSATVKKVTVHTLDINPPKVSQEFTSFPNGSPDKPYANTDVRIIFNENVMRYKPAQVYYDLYQTATNGALSDDQRNAAWTDLAEALRNTIKLYSVDGTATTQVKERTHKADGNYSDNYPANWAIDYWQPTVELKGKQLIITFKGGNNLQLGSGSTYFFHVEGVCDTSDNFNLMGSTDLPRFTTISAQVRMDALNLTEITVPDPTDKNPNQTKKVTADAALVLAPISTNTIDPSINWDMLVWADKTVNIDLYRTDTDDLETTDQSLAGKTWEKVNENPVSIQFTAGQTGYLGASLFQTFDKDTGNTRPSVRNGRLIEGGNPDKPEDYEYKLAENQRYAYAVHITALEGSSEGDDGGNRLTWGKNVTFHFNIATGSTNSLRSLTSGIIDEAKFNTMQTATTQKIESIGIGNVPNDTDTMELVAPFADTLAPEFMTGYPTFTPWDVGVEMAVQLTRPGTLHYVVAPVGSITTTIDDETLSPDIEREELEEILPTSGIFDGDDASEVDERVTVSAPTQDNIINPNYTGNDNIKTGSVYVPGGTIYPIVGGASDQLLANTTYIAYFVTQGTGPYFSEPQAYTFTTTELSLPRITLSPGGTTVSIKPDLTSEVTYKLILKTADLDGTTLGRKLNANDPTTLCGALSAEAVEAANDKYKPDTPYTSSSVEEVFKKYLETSNKGTDSMTVLDAMTENFLTRRSVFDEFANDTFKDQVENYITSQTQGDVNTMMGPTPVTIEAEHYEPVNCNDAMKEAGSYVFLACGHSTQGSAVAFRAHYPLRRQELDFIRINNIALNLEYDTSTQQYDGFIDVIFSKQMYQFTDSSKKDKLPVCNARPDKTTPARYISATTLFLLPNTVTLTGTVGPAKADPSKPVQTLRFEVQNARNAITLTLDGNLVCDKNDMYPKKGNEAAGLAIKIRPLVTKDPTTGAITFDDFEVTINDPVWDGR